MIIRPGMFINDRYEIIDKVGTGGMADVYKAKCHRLNRFIAIKVLKAEYSDDKKFVSKFRAEAQSAAGLSHPNIVNVYDVGEEDDIYYIVMELVEGITLKNFIERKGKLEIKEAVGIAIQIALGMEAAHSNHIIHRDIKPQNIIISKEGKVKVTDFGIAKAASSETITSNAMGSVHYISPEQARGGFSDEKSDIYSLGVTIYEMLTGRVPFVGDTTVSVALLHLQEDPVPLRSLNPDIPVSLDRIVQKCMQKKPERRYLTASALISDLKQSLAQPGGEYVKLAPLIVADDSPTINISDEDLEQIKNKSGNALGDTVEFGNSTRSDARNKYDDDDEFDEEDETSNMDPRLEKLMVVGGVVAAIILVLIIIFFIAQVSGIFGSNTNKLNDATPTPTVTDVQETASPTPEQETSSPEPTTSAQVTVNSVLGLTLEAAKEKLEGLDVQYTEQSSDTYAKGLVASQDIAPNSVVPQGTTINIVISTGSAAITVPNVENYGKTKATTALTTLGLEVTIDYENSDTIEKNLVTRTSPAKGSEVQKGDKITIYISKGKVIEQVTVPNIVGLYEAEARNEIEEEGLDVGTVSYENSDRVEKGKVISQKTGAGNAVDKKTAISFTVSLGKQVTYKYVGNCTITYNPFEYEDETGSIKLILRQNGKSKTIYEESHSMKDFPLSVPDVEGFAEGTGEVTMYVDGVRSGDTYSMTFKKVAR